jgi:uncharacterized protein (DUF736 family)
MAYEMKEKTFSLFSNDKKGNDKAPDWKGKGLIDGKEVRIAVWQRKSASGIEYLSGTIEEPQPVQEEKPAEPDKEVAKVDDEIPFNQDR